MSIARPGLAGIISIIPVFWIARLCGLSIQRGLGVIFPGKSRYGPFRSLIVTFGLAFLIILFVFIMLLTLILETRVMPFVSLSLIVIIIFRMVPVNRNRWKHIIPAALICMIIYQLFSIGMSLLINPARYDLLYGALGKLFLFLLDIYFLFFFFFIGAQILSVFGNSDILLFIRYRKIHSRVVNNQNPEKSVVMPWDRLFTSLPKPLEKYIQKFNKGELIFSRGSRGEEAYYVLSGQAGVYMDKKSMARLNVIDEASFFGELECSESEGRSASIKAEKDTTVLALPRELFRKILFTDPETDHSIIVSLSERLRSNNNLLATSGKEVPETSREVKS